MFISRLGQSQDHFRIFLFILFDFVMPSRRLIFWTDTLAIRERTWLASLNLFCCVSK